MNVVSQYPNGWEDVPTSDDFLSESKTILRKKFDDRKIPYNSEEKPNDCYTAEEIFDDLDKKLIAHFGEEYRDLANVRRTRRNATGLWDFRQL